MPAIDVSTWEEADVIEHPRIGLHSLFGRDFHAFLGCLSDLGIRPCWLGWSDKALRKEPS